MHEEDKGNALSGFIGWLLSAAFCVVVIVGVRVVLAGPDHYIWQYISGTSDVTYYQNQISRAMKLLSSRINREVQDNGPKEVDEDTKLLGAEFVKPMTLVRFYGLTNSNIDEIKYLVEKRYLHRVIIKEQCASDKLREMIRNGAIFIFHYTLKDDTTFEIKVGQCPANKNNPKRAKTN